MLKRQHEQKVQELESSIRDLREEKRQQEAHYVSLG